MTRILCALLLSASLLTACGDTQDLVVERAGEDVADLAPVTVVAEEPRSEWEPEDLVRVEHPDWSRDAVIYEVNVRQFSEAGDFEGVRAQLPRLRDLGVDILWLMPIHPIGEVNRKGTLGSYYSVKDYYGINPEFGTEDDFRRLVDEAHEMGFHVILDWVANHTAWDNPLATDHPDWYERDWKGDFRPTPWWDWSDIIDLDYSVPEVREYMADAMEYWVREFDIDGYRADVAGYVPLDFWEKVRPRLEQHRPVFMLAEWQTRDLHQEAFNATYAWEWKDAMQNIARNGAGPQALYGYYSANESAWPMDAMRMVYTSNHDQNSWDGVPGRIYGNAYEPAVVLQFIGEGIPLIYSGQEAGNTKQLEFFERDPIRWRDHPLNALFTKLTQFKSDNRALHNGAWGARTVKVENTRPQDILTFVREKDGNRVVGIFNLDQRPHSFTFPDSHVEGIYTNFADGSRNAIVQGENRRLDAWGWQVLFQGGESAIGEAEAASPE